VLAHPDWGAAARGLVTPTMTFDRATVLLVTATIGTTLAPWGLSFLQSYAVDKRLTPRDLAYERVDVVTGALLTGIIGFFVVVACAATLHQQGITISDASDAAVALEPLAGHLASGLFAVGLIGAAVLAASILPLSTAYSISEFVGSEGALDAEFTEAPVFYVGFGAVTVIGAAVVLIPGAPLITILVATQALNAVLLLPILVFMYRVARDRDLMGEYRATPLMAAAYLVAIAAIGVCVAALAVLSFA